MRIAIGVVFVAVSLYFALSITDFLAQYVNFLSLLLYLLVPWTAIDLTDFYLIRKGMYHVESFFEADGGIYGRFDAAALGAYAIGVLFELPFMILHTPSYTASWSTTSAVPTSRGSSVWSSRSPCTTPSRAPASST